VSNGDSIEFSCCCGLNFLPFLSPSRKPRTLQELAKEQKRIAAKRNVESPDNEIANKQEQSAQSMLEFLEGARQGEMMPPEVIIQYAKYFQDDLTLDNMPRMQLVNMCRYMQLQPYGADSFLRFQLRHRIRLLKEDDQRIIWEGIDHLTKMELREACQERGMRSTGLSKEAYKRSLQQWLDLSVNKNVPISLLIMSRTFFLQEEITRPAHGDEEAKSVASLADAISGMDKEVLNEVILQVATKEEKKSNPDIRKIKLEVVTQQNERIREERQAAEKKKKTTEKAEHLPVAEEPLAAVELELSPEQAEKLAQVVGAQTNEPQSAVLKVKKLESPASPQEASNEVAENIIVTTEEERDNELSAAEMDAISQLLSADPVSKEREALARLKYAISDKEPIDSEKPEESSSKEAGISKVEEKLESPSLTPDEQAKATIEMMEKAAAKQADESTTFSTESEAIIDKDSSGAPPVLSTHEEVEDPVVAKLKKRLESMVDKIELQLSDVEREIGDKLHILDKDADGVLSQEEMAECLRDVLKREITFEEAMEIAATMVRRGESVSCEDFCEAVGSFY
jgi:LETM1-like protein